MTQYVSRLRKRYQSELAPALVKQLELENPMQVPRLEKIVVNMGIGEAAANPKLLDKASEELALITGPAGTPRRDRPGGAGTRPGRRAPSA